MSTTPDYTRDTIVAAATPPGVGGIAVVRLSGDESAQICKSLTGTIPEPRRATLVSISDQQGEALDRGIALHFPAPNSFTGESVVELHCHGGPTVCNAIVDAALDAGARRAEPGEFSRRAFLNEKIDLVQAEAIADLIESGTTQAAKAALRSLSGAFSAAVLEVQSKLTNLRMHTEAALDFPEEEIDFLSDKALLDKIESCVASFQSLMKETRMGRVLRDGFQMVIVGRPNAGKSSLLNLLSGQEAAIVTEVAGTTRDILRERISIDGLAVELVDTAGLRNDPDRIEAEGIRRARDAISQADAILWIRDASEPDDEKISDLEPNIDDAMPVIRVNNKIDLTDRQPGGDDSEVWMSAKSGEGLDALRRAIRRLAGYRDMGEGAFTARRRHVRSLEQAFSHLQTGHEALTSSGAGEILAEELRLAQAALSAITGEFSSDDLLGKIFSEFCIGK